MLEVLNLLLRASLDIEHALPLRLYVIGPRSHTAKRCKGRHDEGKDGDNTHQRT